MSCASARLYGADFVVMHIGSHRGMGREQGIAALVARARRGAADGRG